MKNISIGGDRNELKTIQPGDQHKHLIAIGRITPIKC